MDGVTGPTGSQGLVGPTGPAGTSVVGGFKADGSVPMTGDLQMGTHKITGLSNGVTDDSAMTKAYIDGADASL